MRTRADRSSPDCHRTRCFPRREGEPDSRRDTSPPGGRSRRRSKLDTANSRGSPVVRDPRSLVAGPHQVDPPKQPRVFRDGIYEDAPTVRRVCDANAVQRAARRDVFERPCAVRRSPPAVIPSNGDRLLSNRQSRERDGRQARHDQSSHCVSLLLGSTSGGLFWPG